MVGVKVGSKDIADAPVVGSTKSGGRSIGRVVLDDPRSSADDVETSISSEVQDLSGRGRVKWLLHLRDRLPRQERLVDDAGSLDEEDVTGYNVIVLGTTCRQKKKLQFQP